MSVHQQLSHRSEDGTAHWMTASSVSNDLSIVHVLLSSKSESEISSRKQFRFRGMLVRKATRLNIQSNIIQRESLVVGDGAGVFTRTQKEEECNTNQVSQSFGMGRSTRSGAVCDDSHDDADGERLDLNGRSVFFLVGSELPF